MDISIEQIGIAIGTVIAGLGVFKFPELYKYWTEKRRIEASQNAEIQALRSQIAEMRVGMGILLTFLKEHFKEDTVMLDVFNQVNDLIKVDHKIKVQ